MKTKKALVVNPTYNDLTDSIHIYCDEDGDEYWSANDLNKFVPSKRVDNFLSSADVKEYREIVEKFIIPGKQGIITKKGKGGGTCFHRLIALRFAAWLSKEFEVQIYLAYDQDRKKSEDWSKERALTKYEYRLMTDAIQSHLISQGGNTYPYAKEASLLNYIVFGSWKFDYNPRESATIQQLETLRILERYNATFIEMDMPQEEREKQLIKMAQQKNLCISSGGV